MEQEDIRNQLLMELIEKMQEMMANKAYPDEMPKEDAMPMAEKPEMPMDMPEKEDMSEGHEDAPEDMELIEQMMKEHGI